MAPSVFVGRSSGPWRVDRIIPVRGETLPNAAFVDVRVGTTEDGVWSLRGVSSHVRYVERAEKGPLDAASPPLGRAEATCAALIPIRKSAAWWSLPQDERRAIFETHSGHIGRSMRFLPRIARRLYHARDLGEPFDFLTWFEFAPEHAAAFDELVGMLRASEEWTYVEREVDIRLVRV